MNVVLYLLAQIQRKQSYNVYQPFYSEPFKVRNLLDLLSLHDLENKEKETLRRWFGITKVL